MTTVRMGEIAVSGQVGAELVALGLGSCIGLAIVDRVAQMAGLAHIVLPESREEPRAPGKFADLAVPELTRRLRQLGGVQGRFEAALVGGAKMFELEGGLDVGARNEHAVRMALATAGIAVHAARTGGQQGRSIRVDVGSGVVTVRVARAEPIVLLGGRPPGGLSIAGGIT
jgi:chemotaxis protein CheD